MIRLERAARRARELAVGAAGATGRWARGLPVSTAARVRGLPAVVRALGFEQRVAGAAALLLVLSTFGPFSWIEAAVILVALAVIGLLHARGEGRAFHLPYGDGAAIAVAGAWSAVLILSRLLDRPAGQGLLALACAALLVLAGTREHARRPPDDIPGGGRGTKSASEAPGGRGAQPTAEAGRGPGPT
jgi:hypothetical protein